MVFASTNPINYSSISYIESPLPKPIMPDPFSINMSKFRENANRAKID